MGSRSGYLPDISGKFNFFLSMAINSLKMNNYNGAYAGLCSMNALLTDKYNITINDGLYKQQVEKENTYRCTNENCTMIQTTITFNESNEEIRNKESVRNEIPSSKVKPFDVSLPLLESILLGGKKISIWICPDCKTENELSKTDIMENKLSNTSFRRVVPSCPIMKVGLPTRSTFKKDFENWFYDFLIQLAHQLSLYRIEYISINGVDMSETTNFPDRGDQ